MNYLEQLVQQLSLLPSIGKKSASRLAYFILKQPVESVEVLSKSIFDARLNIKECQQCFNYTQETMCSFCLSTCRLSSSICVVENPEDILLIDRFGDFEGVYHVLGGCLSPIDGIGPSQLHIEELFLRLKKCEESVEIIIALRTSSEGEATTLYLKEKLKNMSVKVSRLASGIPVGSDLQFIDEFTMEKAMKYRVNL